jgi:signal transduction histidine kinase
MALEVIREKIDVCVQVISACQKYLGCDVNAAGMQCFPVEALELLSHVCAELGSLAAERKVALKINQPRLMAQVLTSTNELERLFSTILELLLKDSAENTTLKIEVEDTAHVSSFRFANCGFGIPNERLQTILASTESPASEPFQVLRRAAVWVRNWGGRLELSSDVGKGYRVTLQLRQFSLTPGPPAANESSFLPGAESQASRRSQLEA